MIRFIDIETGNTFDGSKPYVFWMNKDGLSTSLVYSMNIYYLTTQPSSTVSLDSDAFSLAVIPSDVTSQEDINGVKYYDLTTITHDTSGDKITSLTVEGDMINNTPTAYLYCIHIVGKCDTECEVRDDLIIDGTSFTVGGDFWDEDETLLINLANQGQEIPESVIKALYPVDIRNDSYDNIILNRKWKELLLSSWDTFVCKGSYKSLINCLKWFEWGDIVRLKEYWKSETLGKQWLKEEDLSPLLTQKYKDALDVFSKTTHISLHALAQRQVTNDGSLVYTDGDDKNPALEKIVYKWNREDMDLKLSLLGSFYETYFMPIHLNLLHCTLDDVVYTTAIKDCEGGEVMREDWSEDTGTFKCSVKDGDEFIIENVNCAVGPQTIFGHRWTGEKDYDEMYPIGVDPIDDIKDIATSEEDTYEDSENEELQTRLKTFWSQFTNYTGVIVPFDCEVTGIDTGDTIIEETLSFERVDGEEMIYKSNIMLAPEEDESSVRFRFNLLYSAPGEKTVVAGFRSAGGRSWTKRISFNIIDTGIPTLRIYRVIPKEKPVDGYRLTQTWKDGKYIDESPLVDERINYIFRSSSADSDQVITQWMPVNEKTPICNSVIILNAAGDGSNVINPLDETYSSKRLNDTVIWLKNRYSSYYKITEESHDHYIILVSKEMVGGDYDVRKENEWKGVIDMMDEYKKRHGEGDIYSVRVIFFPEFCTLSPICPESEEDKPFSIDDFTVHRDDAIIINPVIDRGEGDVREMRYIRDGIEDGAWIFENISTGQKTEMPSYQSFIIASRERKALSKGYYTIYYKYNFTNGTRERIIKLNSAFRME